MPRHSPYALFRLNSLACFILSNFQVLAFLLELSQIIVWVANLKRLSKFTFLLPPWFSPKRQNCFLPLFYSEKPNLKIKVFLNIQLSVSFAIRFSMNILWDKSHKIHPLATLSYAFNHLLSSLCGRSIER